MIFPAHIEQLLRFRLWIAQHRIPCIALWLAAGVVFQLVARGTAV